MRIWLTRSRNSKNNSNRFSKSNLLSKPNTVQTSSLLMIPSRPIIQECNPIHQDSSLLNILVTISLGSTELIIPLRLDFLIILERMNWLEWIGMNLLAMLDLCVISIQILKRSISNRFKLINI